MAAKYFDGSAWVPYGATVAGDWVRPSDWPALPAVSASEQKFVGLMAVPTYTHATRLVITGTSLTGTIDWGDGTSTAVSGTGGTYDREWDYATLATPVTSRNYKTALVTVTITAGTVTAFNINTQPTSMGAAMTEIGWLDIELSFPSATTLGLANPSSTALLNMLERLVVRAHAVTSGASYCMNLQGLQYVSLPAGWQPTSVANMFYKCYSLKTAPTLDVSQATSANGFFYQCYALQTAPLYTFGSACTTVQNIFFTCQSMQYAGGVIAPNATSAQSAFFVCDSLREIGTLSLGAVTTTTNMFGTCRSLSRIGTFTPPAVSFSIASNHFDATELNRIYTALPSAAGTITVTSNRGTATDDPSIATAKGWTVTG